MSYTALKPFRHPQTKENVERGDTVEVSDQQTINQLVHNGLIGDAKALKEHENKMLKDFEDKGLPTESETAEQRAQGNNGPSKAGKSASTEKK